jgi:hypothetical protein
MKEFIPLYIALLTSLFILLGYSYQKHLEYKHKMLDMKLEIYKGLLDAIGEVITPGSITDGIKAVQYTQKLNLIAPDNVVISYMDALDPNNSVDGSMEIKFRKMILEMRRDCIGKTNLLEKELAGKKI